MGFKFENLDVWKLALQHIDLIYEIADKLPRSEDFNLRSQIRRAATSVALNIAEGSTGQTDLEQARFLGMALRSLIETVACQHLIHRRNSLPEAELLRKAYRDAEVLSVKLQAFRKMLSPGQSWVREEPTAYSAEVSVSRESSTPF